MNLTAVGGGAPARGAAARAGSQIDTMERNGTARAPAHAVLKTMGTSGGRRGVKSPQPPVKHSNRESLSRQSPAAKKVSRSTGHSEMGTVPNVGTVPMLGGGTGLSLVCRSSPVGLRPQRVADQLVKNARADVRVP